MAECDLTPGRMEAATDELADSLADQAEFDNAIALTNDTIANQMHSSLGFDDDDIEEELEKLISGELPNFSTEPLSPVSSNSNQPISEWQVLSPRGITRQESVFNDSLTSGLEGLGLQEKDSVKKLEGLERPPSALLEDTNMGVAGLTFCRSIQYRENVS